MTSLCLASLIFYVLWHFGTKQTHCVYTSSSFVCPHTLHCDPHVRSKSKAALPSINGFIHEESYTLGQLYICVFWPVFNFSLNVTRLSWGQSFDGTRTKGTNETVALLEPAEYDCFCGLCVQGVGWGYHIMQALELVGRFIVWGWVGSTVDDVHTLWSVVWIQSNAEWMGSDVPKGFAIVCPLFIVHLMVPLMVDMCRNSVGRFKCWNSNVIFMWDKRTHEWN